MNKEGCIIVVEDDSDHQILIDLAFEELNYSNQIIFFSDRESALKFLMEGDKNPFLILSDINLPKLDGFKLRGMLKMNADIHLKCIPYLFFTKSSDFSELKEQIKIIVDYWKHCSAPNNFLPAL